MMTNLFSIFDSNTNNLIDLNWMSSLLNFLMLPLLYWLPASNIYMMNKLVMKFLYKEFKIILLNKFNYLNILFLISLLIMIMLNNLMGLFPYTFTSTSHLIFALSFSLPLWISLMMFMLIKNFNHMFSHMIPQGTPNLLTPFMVLIETISNIIRPGTLAIRLTANMIAGHLLLTLLSESANTIFFISIFIILIQIILLLLEFSVAIIQSYVFTILSTLYIKETN